MVVNVGSTCSPWERAPPQGLILERSPSVAIVHVLHACLGAPGSWAYTLGFDRYSFPPPYRFSGAHQYLKLALGLVPGGADWRVSYGDGVSKS